MRLSALVFGGLFLASLAEGRGAPAPVPAISSVKDMGAKAGPGCDRALTIAYPASWTLIIGSDSDALSHPVEREIQIASAGRLCLTSVAPAGAVTPILAEGGPGGNLFTIHVATVPSMSIEEKLRGHDRAETPLPFARRVVECGAEKCLVGPERCALELAATAEPRAVKDFQSRLGKLAEDPETLGDLIDRLLVRALSGDAKARALLTGTAPSELRGPLADVWHSAVHTYRRGEALCFKNSNV
jgi:hypothetical protein